MKKINRRHFLKNGALLAALLGPASLIGQSNKVKGLTMKQWRDSIDYARWSPSVHNLQPYRIKIISDQKAALYFDTERFLPVGDPKAVFAVVTMGVFVEHLSIAAAKYNKQINIERFVHELSTEQKGLIHFADLVVEERVMAEPLNWDIIHKRRTSRKAYHRKRFRQPGLEAMQEEATRFNHHLEWSNDSDFVEFMIDINQQTLFEDLKNDAMRTELDQLFRYDKKTAKAKKDGLSAKCMGFPGKLIKSIFRNHKKWTRGLRKHLLRKRYKKSFNGTKTIAWMSGPFQTQVDFFTAGRAMARVWLRVTAEGGYIHPFGSLITNAKAYAQMQDQLELPEDTNAKLWMIFRVGYSDTPARSERLPVDHILLRPEHGLLTSFSKLKR